MKKFIAAVSAAVMAFGFGIIFLSGCLSSVGLKPFYSKKEKDKAKNAMEKMGITALSKRCYRELSGAQQQRVLLARALCATKRLLLLDEPAAGLTGDYSSADSVYGDLAVPFYYYAKSRCYGVSMITVIAVFVVLLNIAMEIIIMTTRAYDLTYVAVFLGFVSAALMLAAFIIALDMKNGKILSVYCGGNPSCSIQSFAILPFLTMLAYTVFDGGIGVRLILARRVLK